MKGLGKGRVLERGKGSSGEEAGRCMVRKQRWKEYLPNCQGGRHQNKNQDGNLDQLWVGRDLRAVTFVVTGSLKSVHPSECFQYHAIVFFLNDFAGRQRCVMHWEL